MSKRIARTARPWVRLAPLVALAAAASAAPAAHGANDRFETAEARARALPVLDASGTRQLPFAGYSIREPGLAQWLVVDFYLMFREVSDGEGRRRESYWVARRLDGSDAQKSRTSPQTRWASSDGCAELDATVRSIGDAVQDQIEVAVPGDGDPSESTEPTTRYGLWSDGGRFRGTRYAASLQVNAVAGSPLAVWIDGRSSALAACWLDTAPPTVTVAAP